jgi:hypothetical protein
MGGGGRLIFPDLREHSQMRVTGLLKSTCGKGTRRMQFIATLEGAEMGAGAGKYYL